MKKIIATILILAIAGAGAAYYYLGRDTKEKFRTTPITRGSLRATVTATGTVNAVTTVLVGTQISGTVKTLHVDYNSRVKKGQVIAEIDPATLQAQVDQAKANVMVAKANVLKIKAALQDSARIRNRNRQLFGRNLIAKSELETSESNNDSNEAQLAASEAQVKQTEAALRFAETNLSYTRIVSPVDGIVVSRNVDIGQTVAASFQTPTLFTIAQDLTKMQIDTSVDEADIGKVQSGQGVEFTVDAYPDNTFSGRVSQIRISPVTVQNVVTYDVVIKVDNGDLKLKPGMTANVSIIIALKEGVMKVPNLALRFKPTDKSAPGAGPMNASYRSMGGGMEKPGGGGPTQNEMSGQGRPMGPGGAVGPGGEGRRFGQGRGPGGGPGSGAVGGASGGPVGESQVSQDGAPSQGSEGRKFGPGRGPGGGPGGDPSVEGRGPQRGPGRGMGGVQGQPPSSVMKRYALWVLKNEKPFRIPVAIGISDGLSTEIISDQLKEGQEVIVESLAKTKKTQNNGANQGPPRFIR